MKILLVSHKFPPYSLGGVEIYTHNLAQALRARHEVSVFFRHDDRDGPTFAAYDEDTGGVRTLRVSCAPGGLAASVAGEFFGTFLNRQVEDSFVRFVAQEQPDLIHLQHVMGLSARLLHRSAEYSRQSLTGECDAPVVLTLHDYWFICGNSQLVWPNTLACRGKAWGMNCVRCAAAARFASPLVPWLRPVLAPTFLYRDHVVKQAALQADLLISPSQFLIDQYVAAGFPADRFIYLENGLPTERIRRIPWHSSDGPLRVTFLGSLAWQKGVHVLAEAFNGLPTGSVRLRIWGDLAVFPEYVNRLRHLLTHTDAQLMGRIANEQVGEVLADSDVMVVPSLWYENSPVVIQEARAAGVPVIASGQGALAEKVQDGVNGLLVPPGDAIALRHTLKRLVDEPELLPRLREGIPAPMDIAEHVERLEAIYQQVVKQRRRGS